MSAVAIRQTGSCQNVRPTCCWSTVCLQASRGMLESEMSPGRSRLTCNCIPEKSCYLEIEIEVCFKYMMLLMLQLNEECTAILSYCWC